MTNTQKRLARLGQLWTDAVAYVALLAGAGLSIAGNVANVLRVRGDAVDTLDIVLAVAFPALVVLMVEVFVSSRWRGLSWPMQVLRWIGTLAIGAVAMRVSWVHLHELMVSRGQTADVATLGPLAIDALAIMATALILAGRGRVQTDGHVDSVDTDKRLSNAVDTWMALDKPPLSKPMDTDTHDMAKVFMASPGQPITPLDIDTAVANGFGQLDSDVLDVDVEAEREAEAVDIFARLATEMATDNPTLPVPVSPAPVSMSARGGRGLSTTDSTAAANLAHIGKSNGLNAGEIAELLAGWYGVSTRTLRRQDWWTPVMKGQDA